MKLFSEIGNHNLQKKKIIIMQLERKNMKGTPKTQKTK